MRKRAVRLAFDYEVDHSSRWTPLPVDSDQDRPLGALAAGLSKKGEIDACKRAGLPTDTAETINGLYKAEMIHGRGPWRNFEAAEFATLTWADWFNNRRLLEPLANTPPAQAEEH